MILSIASGVQNGRLRVSGLGNLGSGGGGRGLGIMPALSGNVKNETTAAAEAALNKRFTGVDCLWIPFEGPMGGGTNVCNVAGDDDNYVYGAELVARPGGLDILQQEIASAPGLMAQRAAEQPAILARAAEMNAIDKANAAKNIRPVGVVNTALPAVVQTGTILSQVGQATNNAVPPVALQTASASGATNTPSILGTAFELGQTTVDIPGIGATPAMWLVGAGIVALFFLPKLTGGK